jgi:hypothetical protein
VLAASRSPLRSVSGNVQEDPDSLLTDIPWGHVTIWNMYIHCRVEISIAIAIKARAEGGDRIPAGAIHIHILHSVQAASGADV